MPVRDSVTGRFVYSGGRTVDKKQYYQEYYKKNRDRLLARSRKQREDFPSECAFGKLRSTYGITKDEYLKMYQAQDGKCAVCKQENSQSSMRGKFSLHVDHDHVTKKVRGLLCVQCNLALGHAKDDPELLRKLAEYLEKQCQE